MTDTMCEALLDRMPEVADGRGRWTLDEARHLGECADCRESWRLIRCPPPRYRCRGRV